MGVDLFKTFTTKVLNKKPAIIITSIAGADNSVLKTFAAQSLKKNYHFIVIGDKTSPANFALEGCDYYNLERQKNLEFTFPAICPTKSYARKNIAYLIAAKNQAPFVIETDDDNLPRDSFWTPQKRTQNVPTITKASWVNVYRYYTENNIWPRGFPLENILELPPVWDSLLTQEIDCPIQQGLADDNPDVDAIYRLVLPLPQQFKKNRKVALTKGSWCPFNSQNTCWYPDAYPLMYLPTTCNMRLTDIWRSFVAQRILWENNLGLLFYEPTVWQERNEHNLLKDFSDEIMGYLHNSKICQELESLSLKSGTENFAENMQICYETFIKSDLLEKKELNLLEIWLNDLKS